MVAGNRLCSLLHIATYWRNGGEKWWEKDIWSLYLIFVWIGLTNKCFFLGSTALSPMEVDPPSFSLCGEHGGHLTKSTCCCTGYCTYLPWHHEAVDIVFLWTSSPPSIWSHMSINPHKKKLTTFPPYYFSLLIYEIILCSFNCKLARLEYSSKLFVAFLLSSQFPLNFLHEFSCSLTNLVWSVYIIFFLNPVILDHSNSYLFSLFFRRWFQSWWLGRNFPPLVLPSWRRRGSWYPIGSPVCQTTSAQAYFLAFLWSKHNCWMLPRQRISAIQGGANNCINI